MKIPRSSRGRKNPVTANQIKPKMPDIVGKHRAMLTHLRVRFDLR